MNEKVNKIELSPKERLIIYYMAMGFLGMETPGMVPCLCYAVRSACKTVGYLKLVGMFGDVMLGAFPEIWRRKPATAQKGAYWWPVYRISSMGVHPERITLLKNAIFELEFGIVK